MPLNKQSIHKSFLKPATIGSKVNIFSWDLKRPISVGPSDLIIAGNLIQNIYPQEAERPLSRGLYLDLLWFGIIILKI